VLIQERYLLIPAIIRQPSIPTEANRSAHMDGMKAPSGNPRFTEGHDYSKPGGGMNP